MDEEIAIGELCRLRPGYGPIRTVAVPEQRRDARLAVELRQADRLHVDPEPLRAAVADAHQKGPVPAALLENLHAQRCAAGIVAADQGQTVDPGSADSGAPGNAQNALGPIVPERDLAGRIDDRQSGPELLQQLEIVIRQGLCHSKSPRARLSLRTHVGASIAGDIVAPRRVLSVDSRGRDWY